MENLIGSQVCITCCIEYSASVILYSVLHRSFLDISFHLENSKRICRRFFSPLILPNPSPFFVILASDNQVWILVLFLIVHSGKVVYLHLSNRFLEYHDDCVRRRFQCSRKLISALRDVGVCRQYQYYWTLVSQRKIYCSAWRLEVALVSTISLCCHVGI